MPRYEFRSSTQATAQPAQAQNYGYAQDIDASTITQDPRFIQDLRDYYVLDRGINAARYENDEDLVRRFYRDGVARQVNTVSAIRGAAETQGMGDNGRARVARIERVSRALPNFYEEGGRGIGQGLLDTGRAIITDPTNLVGGAVAGRIAYGAGRTAAATGASNATRRGLMRGAGAAALTEGGISGAQEAVVDTASQMRDIDLGLQDEYSLGRTAAATGVGALVGGATGGLISAPGALYGARAGVREVEQARALGLDDDTIAQLTQDQFAEIARGNVPRDLPASRSAEEPDATLTEPEGEVAGPDRVTEQLASIDRRIENLRRQVAGMRQDGVEPSRWEPYELASSRLALLRSVPERIANAEEQITALAQSNKAADRRNAAERQLALEQLRNDFEAVLRAPSNASPDDITALVNRAIDADDTAEASTPDTPTPDAPETDAPPQETTDAVPQQEQIEPTIEPEPDAEGGTGSPEGGELPQRTSETEDQPPLVFGSPAAQRAFEESGLSPQDITPSGRRGRVLKRDIDEAVQRRASGGEPAASEPRRGLALLTGEDEYASRVRQEALDIINRGAQEGWSAEELFQIADALGRSSAFENQNDLADVIGEMFAEQLDAVDNIGSATAASRNRAARSPEFEAILEEVRKQNPGLPDPVLRIAAQRKLERNATQPDARPRGERSAGDKFDNLGPEAGRDARGKIQSIIKKGRPIARGSDYTVTDGPAPKRRMFDREEALIRARNGIDDKGRTIENYDGIVEYRAKPGEKIIGETGGRRLKKGKPAFAAKNGKVYSTRALARKALGLDKNTEGPQIVEPKAPDAPVEEKRMSVGEALEFYKDDPDGLREWLTKSSRDETPTDDVEPPAKLDADQPAYDGDRILVLRKRTDPRTIRVASPEQMNSDDTLGDLLGARGRRDLQSWEGRYIPVEKYSDDPEEIARVYEQEGVEAAEYDLGDPVTDEPVAPNVPVLAESLEGVVTRGLTAEEADAFKAISKMALGYPIGFKEGGSFEVTAIANLLAKMDSAPWRRFHLGFEEKLKAIETGYRVLAEHAPNGMMGNVVQRKQSVEAIENIFSRHPSNVIAEAKRVVSRIAGDQGVGPEFRQARGKNYALTNYMPSEESKQAHIGLDLKEAESAGRPAMHVLIHEVAHWSYYNILTPQDKLDFWHAMQKHMGVEGRVNRNDFLPENNALRKQEGSPVTTNTGESPQEMFAEQFVTWYTRKNPDSTLNDESIWQRLSRYIKAVFDRYVSGAKLDDDLEPLFSKVLLDDRAIETAQMPVSQPANGAQEWLNFRIGEAQTIRSNLEREINRGSTDGIVNAFKDYQDFLFTLLGKKGDDGVRRTLAALAHKNQRTKRTTQASIYSRIQDIDEILTGKRRGDFGKWDELDEADRQKQIRMLGDALSPENITPEKAEQLADYYFNGYTNWQPAAGANPGIKNPVNASPNRLFDIIEDRIMMAYQSARTGGDGTRPPNLGPRSKHYRTALDRAREDGTIDTLTPYKRRRKAARKTERVNTAAERSAEKTTSTPPKKRKTSNSKRQKTQPAAPSDAPSLEAMSRDQVLQEYKKHRGTKRGDQAAFELMRKKQTEPYTGNLPPLKKGEDRLSGKELAERFKKALDSDDMAAVDRLGGEIQRRAENKRRLISPTISESRAAIRQEARDTAGVASDDGIPAKAAAPVREILSYITHRDPRTQYTLRMATYRMLNLMGKTAKQDLLNTDITTARLNAEEVARLAGTDPADTGYANFVDFRSPEFKAFRTRMRRMSIGLTKGSASPMDVMHEVGHMLVASRRVPGTDLESIVAAYRASDDATKTRIQNAYAGKYAKRSANAREELLAEEWFAESLAEYMAGRVTKEDIGAQLANGGSIELMPRIASMIDRFVEYVSYVVNGLIGRNDIKQTFRRITFYGDMMAKPQPPLAAKSQRVGVPIELAADYAHDYLKASPTARLESMRRYTDGGYGWDAEANEALIFYHGTPSGKAFEDPEVIMGKGGGQYGPGIYVTENQRVAGRVYAERPTPLSVRNIIERAGIDDELAGELNQEWMNLHSHRINLQDMRREYTAAQEQYDAELDSADEITRMMAEMDSAKQDDLARMREMIEEDSYIEAALTQDFVQRLRENNIDFSPDTLPVVIRLKNPADFRINREIGLSDPMFSALVSRLLEKEELSQDGFKSLRSVFAANGQLRGGNAYQRLASAIDPENADSAKAAINSTLKEMGYDGLLTTHGNTVADADGISASVARHTTPILFDSENVKHLEARFFDESDARLRYRSEALIPKGVNGGLARAAMDGEIKSVDDINSGTLAGLLEANGVTNESSSAIMSMMRKRTLTPEETEELKKAGPVKWIRANSTRLQNAGMSWFAGWHKTIYPKIHEQFARKFYPIQDLLRELPDAEGGLRRHFRNSTGGLGQSQPESYKRIVRALRRPSGSRQEANLTAAERRAYEQIRKTLRDEKANLEAAGIMMGDRGPDYFPQVWKPRAIAKNEAAFKEWAGKYYDLESDRLGREIEGVDREIFVSRLYQKLADPDGDGALIPTGVGTATADHIDFARQIELEKYPELMEEAQQFLEEDLDFILTKYLEGSTRRVEVVKQMGVGGHALNDYFHVVQDGAQGIGKLLSSDKVRRRTVNHRGEDQVISETDPMPFTGDIARATAYANDVVEAFNQGGVGAARKMLMDVAVTGPDGRPSPTYVRRVDAIVGALSDFKGRPSDVPQRSDYRLAEDLLAIANRKGIASVSGQGEVMHRTSIALRSFNNISLLAFTTLSSLGDLVLPLIRSGSMRSWGKGFAKTLVDPDYRRMVTNVGVAMENIMQERMIHMYGAPDSRVSNAFFNATMLTPWTDQMRKIAGATGYESFKTMQEKAFRRAAEGKPGNQGLPARYLKRYGLEDYLPGGPKEGIKISDDPSLLAKDAKLREAVIRFANEAVFQPNPDDIPLWAQTPIGAIIFQLKSFPLMMARLSRDVVNEAKRGNPKPLIYLATIGPAGGAAALAVKDYAQSRGGDDGESRELRERTYTQIAESMGFDASMHGDMDTYVGWYIEGLLQMGGVGLLGDIMYSFATQLDNGSYGTVRLMSTVGGPSVGLFGSTTTFLAGVHDAAVVRNDTNGKERAAAREVVSRIPVVGGTRGAREAIVDTIAGPSSRDGSGSSSAYGGGFGEGYGDGYEGGY